MKKNKFYLILFSFTFLFSSEYFYTTSSDYSDDGHINFHYNDKEGSCGENPKKVYIDILLDDKLITQIQMHPDYSKMNNNWWVCRVNNLSYDSRFAFSNLSKEINYEYKYYKIYDSYFLSLENAKKFIINKDYNAGMKNLEKLIASDANSSIKAESQYIIAEVYLNDFKDYNQSSFLLEKILVEYIDTNIYKKALFTLAYIYANHLDYYTDAENYYNLFLSKYPNDELIPSVKYELTTLKKIDKVVKGLNK